MPDAALHPSPDYPTDHMGVRVSIIKTILLRWRDKFPASAFTRLGPRVNMAADLGLALDTPAPPIEARTPISRPEGTPNLPPGPPQRRVEADDFAAALSRGFLPKLEIARRS